MFRGRNQYVRAVCEKLGLSQEPIQSLVFASLRASWLPQPYVVTAHIGVTGKGLTTRTRS